MIAVIFEVEPREGHADAYFELAGELKPLLEGFDGFISVERFEAVLTPGVSCRCRSGATRRRFAAGARWPNTGWRRARAAIGISPATASALQRCCATTR